MARTYDSSDDDLEYRPPTREEVFAQLEDWRQRLHKLYADIISCLPEGEGYETEIRDTLTDEGPMRHAGVPPQPVPELRVVRHGSLRLTFTPDACWIIGVAGRVMIQGIGKRHKLVDSDSPFVEPGWRLYGHDWHERYRVSGYDMSLLRGVPFDRDQLLSLLDQSHG